MSEMSAMQSVEQGCNDWLAIGLVSDIPRRGARIVRTPQGEIAVFRTGGDEIFALNNRCPHKGGPLSEGILSGHTVTCPLHNWRIGLESGEAVAPDVGCVTRYPVRVESGRLYLQLAAHE